MPFRLAHISDVHLGPMPRVRLGQLVGKRVTGWLNWQRRGRSMGADALEAIVADLVNAAPDHVAVTGDLTNLALPAEIVRANAWMASLAPPGGVTAIPGNHDAYVPGALGAVTEAWAMHMRGTRIDGEAYPFLRRLERDDAPPIALVACSTAEATPPFVAAGPFREAQAERLRAMLEEARAAFRVVLIHHPPVAGAIKERKAMRGIEHFERAVARSGAELILHGHTHLPTQARLDVPERVPVIGVAAAGQSPGAYKPAARWNLFEIDGAPGAWRCVQVERGVGMDGAVSELARRELIGAPAFG